MKASSTATEGNLVFSSGSRKASFFAIDVGASGPRGKRSMKFLIYCGGRDGKRITMKIDKDRRLISRVEYHYRESQYVSVDFTLFDTDPVFERETFSNSRLVIMDKGKYKPSMTYKGFEITESNLN